jgi:Na+(H+)/acetate symporter ActP
MATDVLRGRWKDFRLATVLSALPAIALALTVPRLDFALTVPLVFAVAASTFCPLLVLGIWWRGLTATGAIAGVTVGGVLSTLAALFGLFVKLPLGLVGLLIYRPAVVTVPAAFLTMVIVSWATRSEVCGEVDDVLLRLHAPERLGLTHDRI